MAGTIAPGRFDNAVLKLTNREKPLLGSMVVLRRGPLAGAAWWIRPEEAGTPAPEEVAMQEQTRIERHVTSENLLLDFLKGFGRFVGEFFLMCAAMCMGGAVLSLVTFQGLALIGYPDIGRQIPELTILILAILITLPMTAYMQLRKHPIGHNLEMSGVSLGAGLVVLLGYWFSVVPRTTVVGTGIFGLMCGVMCTAMLVDMLIRKNHYAERAQHAHSH